MSKTTCRIAVQIPLLVYNYDFVHVEKHEAYNT